MNRVKSGVFYAVKAAVYVAMAFCLFLLFSNFFGSFYNGKSIYIKMEGTLLGARPLEVYYTYDENGEMSSECMKGFDSADLNNYSYSGAVILPQDGVKFAMLQIGESAKGEAVFKSIRYKDSTGYTDITAEDIKGGMINDCKVSVNDEGNIVLTVDGADPYVSFAIPSLTPYRDYTRVFSFIATVIALVIINRYVRVKSVLSMATDLYQNRRLILSLAVNDFKTKFAGSYFGIIWAFVQPVCTILVFWFVFQIGFRNNDVGDVAFILWFIAGLIPWFFFSEGWNNATMSLIEYSYLVKKVVFKIHILPLVKIISALFVHLFFIAFMVVFYLLYGEAPSLYWLQVIYYSACMILLVIALSYITSALVVFFKDLGQIMNIVLQFGMWLTPIMWSIDMIPGSVMWLFKLNPMYYIVQGYRDSMIYQVPFWNNIKQTLYFWGVLSVLMLLGCIIYRKLKPHFADVL